MRTRTFNWSLGNDENGKGWLPENAGPGFYPASPFVTAHDVMEHLSSKPDWAHELRATGVAVFSLDGVEGRSLRTIASDIAAFAARDHSFRTPAAPARWSKPLQREHESRLQSFAASLREFIERQMQQAMADADLDVPQEAIDNYPTFVDRALPWFRLGYRGAMRVYGAGNGLATGLLMEEIRAAVMANFHSEHPVVGDQLTVTMDPRKRTFTLKRHNIKLAASRRSQVVALEALQELFGQIPHEA